MIVAYERDRTSLVTSEYGASGFSNGYPPGRFVQFGGFERARTTITTIYQLAVNDSDGYNSSMRERMETIPERYWQNWDKGQIAESVDQYWCNERSEIDWRKLLVADIKVEVGKKTRVLEVGCGSGLIYSEMLKRGVVTPKSYIGGDVSDRMLDIARHRFPKATFTHLDILNLPYPDKSQPNVICIHVLQHLPHYAQAVKELIRVTANELYIVTWFTQKPDDNIVFGETQPAYGASFYDNSYSLPKFVASLYADREVKRLCIKQLTDYPGRCSYSISLTLGDKAIR